MARRTVLTGRQRSALFALPQREADLLRHYTLSDEDLQNIGARRRPRNKLGFALQLCVLRHPGRLLTPGEFVPPAVVDFIGRQLDLDGDELADYAVRSETRHEHLAELRRLYGFGSFSGGAARELAERLRKEAEQAQSNEDLVRRFVEACRRTRTILPATTTIERVCADALVDAERRIEARIAEPVPPGLRRDLEHLLEETADAGVTRSSGSGSSSRAAIPPTPTGCWTALSTSGASMFRKASLPLWKWQLKRGPPWPRERGHPGLRQHIRFRAFLSERSRAVGQDLPGPCAQPASRPSAPFCPAVDRESSARCGSA